MRSLTKKQARVYEYIRKCISDKRYSPSIRSIGRKLGYKHYTSSKRLVDKLIEKRWLHRDEDKLLVLGRKEW